MGQGISSIVGLISAIGSIFSIGAGTATQMAYARQQLRPPAQVQQCPPNTDPQYVTGPNGQQQLVCYARNNR